MAVKICNKCGEYNSVSSMICGKCGEVLNGSKVIDQSKDQVRKVKCPNCGEMINATLLKCPECGELITKKEPPLNISYEKKNSNLAKYILSLLIPLVGFILGAIMMSKDDDEKNKTGIICIVLGIVSIMLAALIIYFGIW